MKRIIFSLSLLALCASGVSAEGFKHRPLFEEYTALWCGWCPRGHVAIQMLDEMYGDDHITISYHINDALAVTNTFPMNVQSAPWGSVDREKLIDPYYGETLDVDLAIVDNLEAAMAIETPCSIDVTATLSGTRVNAVSEVVFGEDFDNARYQIGYVLTCSGLTNGRWLQTNEYSSYRDRGTFDGTPLEELTQLGIYVRTFVFDHVAVDVTGMKGVSGSLPASITAGESYSHNHSFNIGSNELIEDPQNLAVVAFVVDKSTGMVVNANEYSFRNPEDDNQENGIGDITTDEEVVSTEYFNLAGLRMSQPAPGICLRRQTLSDGTTRTTKIVIK